ncbi:MAG: translation initiation factor [Anaerolineae bacterium]|nr:translation initiation factor [Anaerolineae bacterium]
MKARQPGRRVVYSTDPESTSSPEPQVESPPPHQQTARIALDRKGRRGKVVTLISGLRLTPAEMNALGKTLRRACGAGGTVKGSIIEVQGDHRQHIKRLLREQGFQVRLVGN